MSEMRVVLPPASDPLFQEGQMIISDGARLMLQLLPEVSVDELLARHVRGDKGIYEGNDRLSIQSRSGLAGSGYEISPNLILLFITDLELRQTLVCEIVEKKLWGPFLGVPSLVPEN